MRRQNISGYISSVWECGSFGGVSGTADCKLSIVDYLDGEVTRWLMQFSVGMYGNLTHSFFVCQMYILAFLIRWQWSCNLQSPPNWLG